MFGYSLLSVLRARRRSLLVILGLSLAVAIVAAPAVALDSEVRTLVDRVVSSIPYDYVATTFSSEFDNASAAAAAVDGVVGAEPVVTPSSNPAFLVGPLPGGGTNLTPVAITFVRPSFERFSDHFGITGSLNLSTGQIAISDRVAGRYGLAVGDSVALMDVVTTCMNGCVSTNVTANFTVGSVLTTPLAASGAFQLTQPLGTGPGRDVVFATLSYLPLFRTVLQLPVPDPPFLRIFVWADRSRLIVPYDPDATQTNVLHLEREVKAALASRSFGVAEGNDPVTGLGLSAVVKTVNDAMAFQRGILLLLSAPAAGLAFLFTRISFETGLAKRRHEIGTLRSRGSDVGMVMSGFLVEALILGAIAALIGFAASVVVSRLFLGLVNAAFPGGTLIPLDTVSVSLVAVGLTIAAAVLTAVLVALPLVSRASNVRIVRALKVTNPMETAVEHQEARSFLYVALGLAGLLAFLSLLGSSGQAGILQFLLGAALSVLLVFAPVLLLVGVARYVTLGTDRPYRALAQVVRPWLGEMEFLVVEGLRRNPRRSSNLAVLVAFALAFAMFVVCLAGTVESHAVRVAETSVGGDLAFDSAGVSPTYLANLSASADVRALALVDFVPSNYGTLVVINATQYLKAVPWLDGYYFSAGDPSAVAGLEVQSGAIANTAAARNLGLHLGDSLVINIISGGGRSGAQIYTILVQVTGIVTALPGLQRSGQDVDLSPVVVVDAQSLLTAGLFAPPLTTPYQRLLVRTTPGVDARVLAKSLEDQFSGTATVYADVLAGLQSDPFRAALLGQLYTEAGLSVLVAVLAVSSVAYASGVEREGEFATVVSRGFDRRRLSVLLFGEGFAVGIIGALPAIPMVLVILWAFLRVAAIVTPYALPLEFLVPTTAWLLLLATLASVAVGSLVAGIRLRWMHLPNVLKLRGI